MTVPLPMPHAPCTPSY